MDPAEERRDIKRHQENCNMLGYVADSEYGIPRRCPCGGRIIDEVRGKEEYDTHPGKHFFSCINYEEQASGQNENDVMKSAHDIFFNDYHGKFTLEHAWRELRFDQKWRSISLPRDGAKEKRKEAAETVPDSEEVRPPGVKASKAAKRKKNGNEAAYDRLQSILDLKQNISKQKLLDRLLSKKETLTESEVSLKDKLVAEML
ncbi:PREDICTED: glutathione S-transferase T2-like [Brassica oleracea var. oleracea]|uniref:Zinc finger GRF-type domain-containing protein n=1 Tax=Brassica oleracea var. oleracea TaxID=109376 RepID=A0A0D3C9K5_BRAOL|nr:PREDICTED: glutathione S-transferase T2-like [Brassica oleracea var. oleracea]